MIPREEEEAFALALLAPMREIMDYVKGRLPPDTHFALIVEAKGRDEGRILAMSTDRQHMARRAGEWVVDVLGEPDAH